VLLHSFFDQLSTRGWRRLQSNLCTPGATQGHVTASPPARTVPRRTAFMLVWALGVPLAHGGVPWAISRLSWRAGWDSDGPGLWHLPGLGPVGLGIAGLIWIMVVAARESLVGLN
jgi:hypothetical protein